MDYLRDCNDQKIQEADFAAIWCSRCLREDCTRSIKGKSRFEARVSSWQERLFTKVPALPETDPRFALIQAKHFQEAPGRPYEVKGWDAPAPPPAAELPQEPAPLPQAPADAFSRIPNQAGRTLSTAPEGRAPGEVVIRPGGRVKVGGSGVVSK